MGKLVIGVTGGIASGKTTVTNHFQKLGIDVVDADQVAREATSVGTPALERIHEHYGETILDASGHLDRKQLRSIIFASEAEKQWLEDLLHPLIRNKILESLNEASGPYVLLSAPLLLENKLDQLTNFILVIDVPEEVQISRACFRDNNDKNLIKKIIDSQISREKRLAQADFIIDNSTTTEATICQIENFHSQFLTLAHNII